MTAAKFESNNRLIPAVQASGIDAVGVQGSSVTNYGVRGVSDDVGVVGEAGRIGTAGFGAGRGGTGVLGNGRSIGVHGLSEVIGFDEGNRIGVLGESDFIGVRGLVLNGTGVEGMSILAGEGVIGYSGTGAAVLGIGHRGFAGDFHGDVHVSGKLLKSGGGFQIDHPLDPARKSLSHSFVESSEMKNLYDGVAVLDANGEATVTVPSWCEALNSDFRYQLTPIGAPAPNLFVADKIQNNEFRIAGGTPGLEVSWQVTGIRQDAWAKANRILVEHDKPAHEQDHYQQPDLHGESEQKSLVRARYPRLEVPVPPEQ